MLRPDVTARLQAQMSVNVQELAAAKWVFGLLDFDNDGEFDWHSDIIHTLRSLGLHRRSSHIGLGGGGCCRARSCFSVTSYLVMFMGPACSCQAIPEGAHLLTGGSPGAPWRPKAALLVRTGVPD